METFEEKMSFSPDLTKNYQVLNFFCKHLKMNYRPSSFKPKTCCSDSPSNIIDHIKTVT